ncbi:MAG: hypothetical protein KJ732_03330, partial [Candidatus Margulisbacteria bacterium]|nr:hypothetical protein [Candidatus Margulisiibacteriota bacterium]
MRNIKYGWLSRLRIIINNVLRDPVKTGLVVSCLLLVNFLALPAKAAIPEKINIQGVLMQDGKPVTAQTTVTFGIYDVETSGTTIGEKGVPVTPDDNGFFSTFIDVSSFDLAFNEPYWVEIKIDNTELIPR